MELAASTYETAGDRRRPVAGTHNLRDTGGYAAGDGLTRWGKLYRSDALHLVSDEGRVELARLGIGVVVDLRDDAELLSSPSRLDGLDLVVHHVPIFQGAAPAALALEGITLSSLYHSIIEQFGDNLATAARLIATSGDTPVLVHCTAGKDRTGLVVALSLLAAGVDRAEVVADYTQTEGNLRGAWSTAMLAKILDQAGQVSPEVEQIVTASPAEVLDEIIDSIEAEYGSATGYLTAHGLTEEEISQFRSSLIEYPSLTKEDEK